MALRIPHTLSSPPVSGQTGRVFASLINSRRIPQALLLTGIEGIGKNVAAIQFAASVNCENRSTVQPDPAEMETWRCGECGSCRKILSDNHPDVLTVEPHKDQIRIDTIRSLIADLGFTPYNAQYRFVLIQSAEKMTTAASNALLKILEEPPKQTHFLLTTSNVADLLPTILSRCQIIRFGPWPDSVIVSHLIDQFALNQTVAEMTVKLAAGSQFKAIELAKKNWVITHQWAMDALQHIDQLSTRQKLVLAERLAEKKNSLETLLIWLKTVTLDKAKKISIITVPNEANTNNRETILRLIGCCETIDRALFWLSTNVNSRMVLEKMLIRLTAIQTITRGEGF